MSLRSLLLTLIFGLALPVVGCQSHDKHHKHGEGEGPIGRRFKTPEDLSKRWDDPARDAWQKPGEVVGLMGIEPGMAAVDLGSGTGYFLPHLSKAVGTDGTVLALDVEDEMVAYLGGRIEREAIGNASTRKVPFDDPQLEAGSVDRVLIVNTWHHISGREAYASKLAAGLRPGGAVVIVDYTMDTNPGPPMDHRLAPETVVAELEAGGFEATVAAESLPRQFVVIGRKKAE